MTFPLDAGAGKASQIKCEANRDNVPLTASKLASNSAEDEQTYGQIQQAAIERNINYEDFEEIMQSLKIVTSTTPWG